MLVESLTRVITYPIWCLIGINLAEKIPIILGLADYNIKQPTIIICYDQIVAKNVQIQAKSC